MLPRHVGRKPLLNWGARSGGFHFFRGGENKALGLVRGSNGEFCTTPEASINHLIDTHFMSSVGHMTKPRVALFFVFVVYFVLFKETVQTTMSARNYVVNLAVLNHHYGRFTRLMY